MAGTTGGGRRGRGKRARIAGINVTPMVDVVLVLLVIMMVSATYIVSQSLKVELPKTASSDEASPAVATVTLAKDGKIYFDQLVIAEAELQPKLALLHRQSEDVNLVVTADREVQHGNVVHVIDVAKREGITKFAITVERTE